jgi:CRP/FNR family transcriptional regulator
MNDEVHICLKQLPVFASLDQTARDKICYYASKRLYQVNEFIFRQDEIADTIYLLMYGVVKLFRVNEDGTETILNFVSPGEIIGYNTFFITDVHNYASCIAVKDSKICCIERGSFEELLMTDPGLMKATLFRMSDYLADLNRTFLVNKTMTAKEKLKSAFLSLGQDHGVVTENGVRINLKLTQQELADMIGISRGVASNLITELV